MMDITFPAGPHARFVEASWKAQRFVKGYWIREGDEAIYQKLVSLPDDAGRRAIADAIGNESWSYEFCSRCSEYTDEAVSFNSTITLCRRCTRLVFGEIQSHWPDLYTAPLAVGLSRDRIYLIVLNANMVAHDVFSGLHNSLNALGVSFTLVPVDGDPWKAIAIIGEEKKS